MEPQYFGRDPQGITVGCTFLPFYHRSFSTSRVFPQTYLRQSQPATLSVSRDQRGKCTLFCHKADSLSPQPVFRITVLSLSYHNLISSQHYYSRYWLQLIPWKERASVECVIVLHSLQTHALYFTSCIYWLQDVSGYRCQRVQTKPQHSSWSGALHDER